MDTVRRVLRLSPVGDPRRAALLLLPFLPNPGSRGSPFHHYPSQHRRPGAFCFRSSSRLAASSFLPARLLASVRSYLLPRRARCKLEDRYLTGSFVISLRCFFTPLMVRMGKSPFPVASVWWWWRRHPRSSKSRNDDGLRASFQHHVFRRLTCLPRSFLE
ncbi:hypothetical protein F4780DRAFT_422867 [Xylariomycetidae sp. FL0641]|nr:hypothetical protein F4780DRAFT_422867 [Xylariomycetidae sp. FL0641]